MTMIARIAAAGALAVGLAGWASTAAAVEIRELTSPGGTEFWLVTEPAIPIVAVEIAFEGGARLDPEAAPGLSRMVAGLMDEGAGEMDAVAFAEAKDLISARFGFSAGRDKIDVSARTLSENAMETAALLGTALAEPRFDAEAVERIRGQILSGIAERETDPQAQAGLAWNARAFPDHPYGRPVDGTAESVTAFTEADLRGQHARLFSRAQATVGIVGDIGPEAAGRLVDTILGKLPEGEALPAPEAAGPPPPGTEVVTLDVPQSVAVFGHAGLAREDPDFFPAYVMNYVLGGGGFSSRLVTEVREKRGLAYGVYSYLQDRDAADLYLGGVATTNERIAESLEVIRAEWARMAEEGVTEEELADAKTYLTGAFPLRFDSNAKIAGYLVFMQEEGLPPSYLDTRNDRIEAVTREDIARVAARVLKPDQLSIVVVGQPVGL